RAPALSKVLGAPLHRVFPDIVAIIVEDDLRVYWRYEPSIAREFTFQLIRAPSGIAESNETLARTLVVANGTQDVGARRHRDSPIDIDRFDPPIVRTMDHESKFRRNRAPLIDGHVAGQRVFGAAEGLQHRCERASTDGSIDHDAEGAVLIVTHHENDSVIEARIAHSRRGNQQLASKKRATRDLTRRQCRSHKRRRGEHRSEHQGQREEVESLQAHGIPRRQQMRPAPEYCHNRKTSLLKSREIQSWLSRCCPHTVSGPRFPSADRRNAAGWRARCS